MNLQSGYSKLHQHTVSLIPSTKMIGGQFFKLLHFNLKQRTTDCCVPVKPSPSQLALTILLESHSVSIAVQRCLGQSCLLFIVPVGCAAECPGRHNYKEHSCTAIDEATEQHSNNGKHHSQ